ncbi:hypothetical protein CSUB01_09143 [Colletotrichum sublineola]|uniref:Pfs domain-containing protein n=1 Tax=Colletotrichum sublineola TaxID=1173701 RepID=A0A066XG20_COLSU|nr:hypothetical protein CSUB01_09143 [Colletotrichum sublineola]
MADTQPNTDEGVDNVDKSASVSIGCKRKREQDSELDSDGNSRRRTRESNNSGDVSKNRTSIPTADYTVGWVGALPLEMAAARGMLDEVYPNLPEQDPADHNSYILGEVQGHKVVIACLPAGIYGTTPAATVAKDLLRTFKSIRFVLMVGIGGGAPSQELGRDLRLGDIVVRQPSGTSGGIIQYDRRKMVQEGEFQRTGSLNEPPQVLLAALSRLQADHLIEDSKMPQFLQELFSKIPERMKKKFSHQGVANDHLFHAGYDHVSPDATCEQCCDQSQTVKRDGRDDTDPVIHYGNIASGNLVIEDAKTRDRLGEELGGECSVSRRRPRGCRIFRAW